MEPPRRQGRQEKEKSDRFRCVLSCRAYKGKSDSLSEFLWDGHLARPNNAS
ncbi:MULTISPECIES: hypothetical protein [unclassified Scytonema]|uniref:hypothetical protein n=1 Tax=unclassified Scytonema TaxID=2618749 RepID=UPI000A9A8878|nr:hypothetical protein [Scytonema sp. HK-05]